MARLPILRIALPVLAIASVFIFPWLVTVGFMTAAALVFPPIALFLGLLAEILYYPGTGFPVAAVTGVFIFLAASGVRYFAQTSILRP